MIEILIKNGCGFFVLFIVLGFVLEYAIIFLGEGMKTIKAGCFLIDKENGTIAIIYRTKQKDYSFPKGHLEEGEDIKACALRETAEETKREAEILEKFPPFVEEYSTPSGEECVCYMYFALDKGKSDNTSPDTHEVHWIPFDEVEGILSYPSLKKTWNSVKANVQKILQQ